MPNSFSPHPRSCSCSAFVFIAASFFMAASELRHIVVLKLNSTAMILNVALRPEDICTIQEPSQTELEEGSFVLIHRQDRSKEIFYRDRIGGKKERKIRLALDRQDRKKMVTPFFQFQPNPAPGWALFISFFFFFFFFFLLFLASPVVIPPFVFGPFCYSVESRRKANPTDCIGSLMHTFTNVAL